MDHGIARAVQNEVLPIQGTDSHEPRKPNGNERLDGNADCPIFRKRRYPAMALKLNGIGQCRSSRSKGQCLNFRELMTVSSRLRLG
jgi:hypothetical protein